MKFRSRSDITDKIPNKYDAIIAISNRVKLLVEGKERLVDEFDENNIKIAMEEIASGALIVEVEDKPEKK